MNYIKKRNHFLDSKNPDLVVNQVINGSLVPCEMNKKIYDLQVEKEKSSKNIVTVKKEDKFEDLDAKKARAKSVERTAIKL